LEVVSCVHVKTLAPSNQNTSNCSSNPTQSVKALIRHVISC